MLISDWIKEIKEKEEKEIEEIKDKITAYGCSDLNELEKKYDEIGKVLRKADYLSCEAKEKLL